MIMELTNKFEELSHRYGLVLNTSDKIYIMKYPECTMNIVHYNPAYKKLFFATKLLYKDGDLVCDEYKVINWNENLFPEEVYTTLNGIMKNYKEYQIEVKKTTIGKDFE